MAITSLLRRYRFCAGHRYYRDDWSEERNRRVFGKCANPVGHGHNYRLEVEVTGPVDPDTGFLADLAALDEGVGEVLEKLDHRHLNEDTPWFREQIPTTENLARLLWRLLCARLEVKLVGLRLDEDDRLSVRIRPGACEDECVSGEETGAGRQEEAP